jgi:hypothetical protein
MSENKKQKIVKLAGFILFHIGTEGNKDIYVPAPIRKSPFVKPPTDDYLEKTKETMKKMGVLKQYLKSLEPQNRECAGCM